ncbi:centrosomal protein of 128 kDa-like isoform X2 [Pecten maximus]|uniref:centrosomal protein of 128 kDa-like isoform X2 n=1 Tax=Pecten maximus TaxID=6579 RepID=UPI001458FF5B|nr:centrosomal protein of 128 kDa-like isoform X2 [Pecten maximus]
MDDRIHQLTDNLQGTTRNLRSLDRMLGTYRDVGREQRGAVDKLRDDLRVTQSELERERVRSPLHRDYGSDSEYEVSPLANRRRRKRRSTVRFADDMNRELHGLHRSFRDLSNDHFDLETSLNRESERRDRNDLDSRRTMREISDNLKRLPHSDPVAMRVEERLAAIQNELRSERQSLNRYDELVNLSTDLRQALNTHQHLLTQPSRSAMDERLQTQYIQAESQKNRIESELDAVKRKLDQTAGGKAALEQQVGDLRAQLNRMEQERSRMKTHLEESRYEEEVRDRRKKQSLEEERDRVRRSLEKEVMDLRGQLARSMGNHSEMDELRRGIDRSERQRAQLSDHIETLTRDLENREKQTAKLITQLKETSDKFEEADRHKGQLMAQYEDTMGRLKECSKELEKTSTELRGTQGSLSDAERKRDEFKGRAQETVRQWKLKTKQLEREVDRHKHGANTLMQRNEQLVKELEGMRHQLHHQGVQMDNLKRELGDALAVRAAQDEQIRLKDVEINELKSVRMDLDHELRDSRTVCDRMENELNTAQTRSSTLSEEKNRLEEKLSSVEAAHLLSQDQSNQLQQELKELSSVKAEFASQLSLANGKIHDLRHNFVELQHREKAAREEVKIYQRQLAEERESHHNTVENIKQELNEVKVREAHVMQDIQRKMKRGHAEYEATIQALKMELGEEKSSSKIYKRNEEKLRQEAERLTHEVERLEEENTNILRRLEHAHQEFQTQTQMAESDMSRVKKYEDELFLLKNELKKSRADHDGLVYDMVSEVDSLMELAATGSMEKRQTVTAVKGAPNGPNTTTADIKSKMKWLRQELRDRIKYEQKMRKDLREALTCNDNDRQFLLAELAKREDVLDELSTAKQELAYRDLDNVQAVEKLQEHILDLTDELELRKIREEEILRAQESDKQHIIEDLHELRTVQEEKARIEDRYLRLSETMRALQEEIKSANIGGNKATEFERERNAGNLRKSSTPRKKNQRVRIHEGPKRPITPPSKFKKGQTPPMALSEEEFQQRYMSQKNC